MIVSPSDVINEREIIRHIIYVWNTVHSSSKGLVLQPSGWEINSYPQMGGHPQAILNKQLLDNADIIIGVFWTRLGTKTEEYDSGTVEEITRHIKSGKPASLYFSNAPVRLESVDNDQYIKLKEYQKSICKEGFYFEYDKIESFHSLVSKHLQLMINDKTNNMLGIDLNETQLLEENEIFLDAKVRIISNLTETAKFILKEASLAPTGTFMKLYVMGGVHFETNGKAWMFSRSKPKELAELEEAIDLLESYHLITTRSAKRESFNLTADGFRLAETYELPTDA